MSETAKIAKILVGPSGVNVFREPLIVGMKDKDGNPIHAIQLSNGDVYMTPEHFDRLKAEIDKRDGHE